MGAKITDQHPSSFSPQQSDALAAVRKWIDGEGNQVFRLFGYAGTGKTTLAREISTFVDGHVPFAAFTGKAAQVLRNKGCGNASTIHSLIYNIKAHKQTGSLITKVKSRKEFEGVKLIVIDECSMVGEDIGGDLLSLGIPVLVLGDPAQLPPVKGGGFFTDHKPDFMLDEVHRQAADNPIIEMSMKVRMGERLQYGAYGDVDIISRDDLDTDRITKSDQVLCGLNKTRSAYNRRLRELAGLSGDYPVVGDVLVCLKNNRDLGLFNGSLWRVLDVKSDKEKSKFHVQSIDNEDHKVASVVDNRSWDEHAWKQLDWRERRGSDEFTYGYALTVHKSQGSQWDDVVLFDESGAFRDDAARHLYTGITRAAKRLTVVQ